MTALSDYFTSLATKIRSKTGKSATLTPSQMIPEIDAVFEAGNNYGPALSSTKCRAMTLSNSTWETKEFYISPPSITGQYVWTDGDNIYYSNSLKQYVLDKSTNTWEPKTWSGLTKFGGDSIWTDGVDIYYSYNSQNYVLNKSTSTWEPKTWSGLTNSRSDYIWTDGDNIYYSNALNQYILPRKRMFK